jgi:hypothetical protein
MDLSRLEANYRPYDLSNAGRAQQNPKTTGRGGSATAFISEGSGIGGALLGGAKGAAIGSVVPGIGTALGGIIGAGIGGFAGGTAGKLAENKIRDDEFRPGQALKEGAIEGVFSAGPLRLGKLAKAGIGAARAGTPILQEVAEAAAKPGVVRSILQKGGAKTYAQAFDIPNNRFASSSLKPQQTANELIQYGVGGSIENIQKTATDVNSIIGRQVTNAAQSVGGDIKTGDVINIANKALQGVDVSPSQRQNFITRVTNIGSDGALPDRISPLDALERSRDLKSRGYNFISAGSAPGNPRPDLVEFGRAHVLVADELEDGLYKAIGSRGGMKQFQTRETAQQLNKLAKGLGDRFLKAKDVSEVRSLMAPFVRANQLASITLERQGASTGTNIMGNLGSRGVGAAGGFAVGGPVGGAAGFLGAPLLQAAGQTAQAPLATGVGRAVGRLGTAGSGPALGTAARATLGAGVSATTNAAQPQDLESALMQSSGGFGEGMSAESGMQQAQLGMGGLGQQMGGGMGMPPQSQNPYTRENLISDIQRDPRNAQEYIKQFVMLEEIFGGQQQSLDPERAQYLQTTITSGATVLDDATRALELVRSGAPAAGTLPSKLGFIRESPAGQLRDLVNSVKANIGIDTLLSIKQSGAGLGQVPQSQLEELQRVLGELDPGMNAKQLERNLGRIQSIYRDVVGNLQSELNSGGGFAPQYAQNMGLEQALMQTQGGF